MQLDWFPVICRRDVAPGRFRNKIATAGVSELVL